MKINYKKSADNKDTILLIPCFDKGENLPAHLKQWLSERVKNQQFAYKFAR